MRRQRINLPQADSHLTVCIHGHVLFQPVAFVPHSESEAKLSAEGFTHARGKVCNVWELADDWLVQIYQVDFNKQFLQRARACLLWLMVLGRFHCTCQVTACCASYFSYAVVVCCKETPASMQLCQALNAYCRPCRCHLAIIAQTRRSERSSQPCQSVTGPVYPRFSHPNEHSRP